MPYKPYNSSNKQAELQAVCNKRRQVVLGHTTHQKKDEFTQALQADFWRPYWVDLRL
jgi:hypothetical protein